MKPRAKPDWFVLRDEDDYTTRRITVPLSCFMRASHSLSQIIEARWAESQSPWVPKGQYLNETDLPDPMGHQWIGGKCGASRHHGERLECSRCAMAWHEHREDPVECGDRRVGDRQAAWAREYDPKRMDPDPV